MTTRCRRHRGALLVARVGISTPHVKRTLVECLRALGVEPVVAEPNGVASATQKGVIQFVEASAIGGTHSLVPPVVVVLTGMTVCDKLLSGIVGAGVAVIDSDDLTPRNLLQAMLRLTLGKNATTIETDLTSSPGLRRVPHALVDAFLAAPKQMLRLHDVQRALRISQWAARKLVHSAGFTRAEHLFTMMRAEVWRWCASRGMERAMFEHYLGIRDRSTFRRACRRAGIQPLEARQGPATSNA